MQGKSTGELEKQKKRTEEIVSLGRDKAAMHVHQTIFKCSHVQFIREWKKNKCGMDKDQERENLHLKV